MTVGFLTGSAHDAKRIRQTVEWLDRLEPPIASRSGAPARSFSSVWVRPTSGPSSDVYTGTFLEWSDDGATPSSTGETVKIREAGGGKLELNKPYLGRIVGESSGVPVVQVRMGVAGDLSSDCAPILGLVRANQCMSMAITEREGACACIVGTQTADLTWDADEGALTSADLLYGCPPGVLTTICNGGLNTGAPKKWNIVVSGFGAPNENLNQSYTITHSTGETWTVTKNGVTVTAVRGLSGWTLTIDDGTVTVTYDTAMAFCCQAIEFDIDDDDGTTTPPATLDMTIATACGNGPSYTPRLERVSGDCGLCLKFTWVPTAGSGSRVIPWKQVGCGEDAEGQPFVEFATDDPLICTGEDGESCTGNRVVVRLTCVCCEGTTPNWFGPGWYKLLTGNCLYLSNNPGEGHFPCEGFNTAICSGPYEEEPEDCDTECEITISGGCECAIVMPGSMCVSFAIDSLGTTGLDDWGLGGRSFRVTYDPSAGWWAWINEEGKLIRRVVSESGHYGELFLTSVKVTPLCGGFRIVAAGFYRTYDPDGTENGSATWALGVNGGGGFPSYAYTAPACMATISGNNAPCCYVGETVSGTSQASGGVWISPYTNGPVYELSVDTGTLAADGDCDEGEEPTESWNCIPDTGCVEVFDGSGEYPSEAECNANCFGSGGGGGSADCPGPESWSFTFSGFTGCLADLNASHTLLHWFTSGGVKSWYKLVTVNGYTAYIQLSAGKLAGVPYLTMSVVQYSGTIGNTVGTLASFSNMFAPNCCDAITLTSSGFGYCPGTTPLAGCGCTVPASVALTPSGACT